MDKANISLTVECVPDMAARLPQVVALIKLNGTDGTPDYLDDDDDNDGILTADEIGEAQSCGDAPDCDADGVPDYLDTDSDDDGEPDGTDTSQECVNSGGICLPIVCKESN